MPTDGVPTDGVPTDGVPTDGVPTDGVPTDGVPTDGVPTDGVPTDGVPTDGVPTDGVPTDGATALGGVMRSARAGSSRGVGFVRSSLRQGSLSAARSLLARLAARHPVWVEQVLDPVRSDGDAPVADQMLDQVYSQLLGRQPDPNGRLAYQQAMANGVPAFEVVLSVATSDEYRERCRREMLGGVDSWPRHRDPGRFRFLNDQSIWTFEVSTEEDFDWMEESIVGGGYYERPHVWSLDVDLDKRVMAEIVGSLGPGPVLEIGCASGAVLEGLHEQGIPFTGVDISQMAVEHASERVRPHLLHGDLLELDLDRRFATAFGLDIFEHLNPNRLARYLGRMAELMRPGGLLFANIPAFGRDEVFGEIFSYYLPGWTDDSRDGRCFRRIHVDDAGYPINGHLIWADTRWWVQQFELAGFYRRKEIERAIQEKYGAYLGARARLACRPTSFPLEYRWTSRV